VSKPVIANQKRRAVFLDRDGTIILDRGYLKEVRQVCLVDGVGEALAHLTEHGFALVVISNQSGIGRAMITPEQAEQVHQAVVERLLEYGVRLDAALYCPHTPEDNCACRKPSPEMIVRAAREVGIDLARSFMIGDKQCDIEAGKQAGCRTILLANGTAPSFQEPQPDMVASDWAEASRYIFSTQGKLA
jgi:D-glycero-D-manno-heptose 1,7-bisphosphate phosphatase